MSVSKTMRLSESTIEFIEEYPGSNFTESFETMVNYFKNKKSLYENDIMRLKSEIDNYNNKLNMAKKHMRGIDMINDSFNRLKHDITCASDCIEDFVLKNKL